MRPGTFKVKAEYRHLVVLLKIPYVDQQQSIVAYLKLKVSVLQ